MMFKLAAAILMLLAIGYQGQGYFDQRLEQIEHAGQDNKIRNIFESYPKPDLAHNTLTLTNTQRIENKQLHLQNPTNQQTYQLHEPFQIDAIGTLSHAASNSLFDAQFIGLPLSKLSHLNIPAHQLARCANECKDTILHAAQSYPMSLQRNNDLLISTIANTIINDKQSPFMACYRLSGQKAISSDSHSPLPQSEATKTIWYLESVQSIACQTV